MPVARENQNLYFGTGSSVINAFIEERNDYPKILPRNSMSGFTFVSEGRIATMRSPAFLDYREKAFEGVEHLLEPLIAAGKARQVATSSSESLVSSEHVNIEGQLTSVASFSLNACSEEAVTLDEEWSDPDFQLPFDTARIYRSRALSA